jgi:tetratricopeptide (TPR) repeat protein/predicted Ser/Thr protein kinase
MSSAMHLDASDAVDLVSGHLGPDATARIEAHVATCSDCRALIAALVRATDPAPTTAPDAGVALSLERGMRVGRYVVLEAYAHGGMGAVYRAYDPELERTIALKLVRPGRDDEHARGRLVREARALAQLAHPNVVAVHDAGQFGDHVFIAMEFVAGQPLRRWLEGGPRSRRAIVAALAAAGRGLEAAHAAGVIHRDVKPDNIIVGDDGRVRILDFGLARADEDEPAAHDDTLPDPHPDASLTRTGAVVGTPAYMAPEQHRGQAVDARTDQFGFCVTAFEALYGQRPFPDAGLVEAVVAGRLREPPHDRRVPARLRRVIVRGLAPAPADRHPSMAPLLAELERAPSGRRTLIAAALIAGAAAGGVALATTGGAGPAPPAPCEGAAAALADTWTPADHAALAGAFAGAEPRHGAATATRVAGALDAYASAWQRMHRDACLATRVRGDQSEDVLDLRMLCLERSKKDLGALVALFRTADAKLVADGVKIASSLPAIADCGDIAALTAPIPLPHDPARRVELVTLYAELAKARALRLAGRFGEGLVASQALLAHAQRFGYPPMTAEALFQVEFTYSSSGDAAHTEEIGEDAVFAAIAAHHPAIAARAAVELIWNLGVSADRRVEARRWGRLAEAQIAALGGNDELEALLAGTLGSMALYGSDPDAAQRELTRALELERKVATGDSMHVARALANLAIAYYNRRDYARSGELLREAVDMFERTLGPDNPYLIEPTGNLAQLYVETNQLDLARRYADRAHALAVDAYGADSPQAGRALSARIALAQLSGDRTTAIALARAQIAALGHGLGERSGEVGVAWTTLGEVLAQFGDDRGARAALETALPIEEAAYGKQSRDLAGTLRALAPVLARLGQRDLALARATQARDTFVGLYGLANLDTAMAQLTLGKVLLDRGAPALAQPLFEAALATATSLGAPGDQRGEIERALADLRWPTDPVSARAHASASRAAFLSTGAAGAAAVAELDQWLKDHPAPAHR